MSKLIEGRIAQIVSENYVVINAGVSAGVKVGMAFVVLAQGEDVKDPDTGEALGRWEMPKGYIRATHVQERLATCEGFAPGRDTTPEDPSTDVLSAALITHSMRPASWREGRDTRLNVKRSEILGMPKIGPITVGDVVREFRPESAAPPSEPEGKKGGGQARGMK